MLGVSASFEMGSSAPSTPTPAPHSSLTPEEMRISEAKQKANEIAEKRQLKEQHQEQKRKLATQIKQSSWRRRRAEHTRRRRHLSEAEEDKEREHDRAHKRQVQMTHLVRVSSRDRCFLRRY